MLLHSLEHDHTKELVDHFVFLECTLIGECAITDES